jgi:hypothetical protein
MKSRRCAGQSMVEYGIGIGCVVAVCMLVMGGLGFAAEDVPLRVLRNINSASSQTSDPSQGSQGGIFANGIRGGTPWKPR